MKLPCPTCNLGIYLECPSCEQNFLHGPKRCCLCRTPDPTPSNFLRSVAARKGKAYGE